MGHAGVSKNADCDYQKESVSLHIHLFNILLNEVPTCVEPTGSRRRQNPVTIKRVIERADAELNPPLMVLMIVCLLFSNDKLYVKLQTSRQQLSSTHHTALISGGYLQAEHLISAFTYCTSDV